MIAFGLSVLLWALLPGTLAAPISAYDVVWTDLQSESSQFYTNTMPIGNGYLAANVLGGDLQAGSVALLVSQSGAWSEAGELIKVAVVNISFAPNPFAKGSFIQMRLDIARATVVLLLGGPSSSHAAMQVELYVDAHSDVIVVDALSLDQEPYTASVVVTRVREKSANVSPAFDCTSYIVSADVLAPALQQLPNALVLYHRNDNTTFFTNTLACKEKERKGE